jgi:hypothetical protein
MDLVVNKEHVPGVNEELVPPAVQLAGHDLVQVLLHHPDRKHSVTIKQYCGSGMFIPDPDFYPSRNTDLRTRIQQQYQKRRGTIFLSYHFL